MQASSTLPRTVEPELMEDPEQVAAYTAADFTQADEAFVAACEAWLRDVGVAPPRRILDLGCGPGNIALRLAVAFPEAEILGVDGSGAMIAVARQLTPAGARVEWVTATLPDEGLPVANFDLVVSNSLLHHLHDPSVLWHAVRRQARPGAPFFVGDLRRPASQDALDRCVANALPHDVPAVLRHDFIASLHAAFTVDEVARQLAQAGLDGGFTGPSGRRSSGEVVATGERHLRVFGRTAA
jgi:SAM-dependent methyltransferase